MFMVVMAKKKLKLIINIIVCTYILYYTYVVYNNRFRIINWNNFYICFKISIKIKMYLNCLNLPIDILFLHKLEFIIGVKNL